MKWQSLIHIGLLFIYGTPEWKPIVTTYLGMILVGGCFISLGLFISSMTKQIVAGMITFAAFLLWVINWMGSFVGPTAQAVLAHLSIIDHFDDFAKKGIIDTKHLIYYLASLHRVVPHGQGRGCRTVAGLMIEKLVAQSAGWDGDRLRGSRDPLRAAGVERAPNGAPGPDWSASSSTWSGSGATWCVLQRPRRATARCRS